ncbi:MAG: Mut7-C RNAse domain-containing protein [Candidatus Omnitrophica bacterium]|nr:Mut7-C RNAse domain-containing protein [Candidatus Omnitrophota bacterium]MBU1853175.1 Mut7-C RNAse domain-containing protein [Candidatus Omnitrophota bacterium]
MKFILTKELGRLTRWLRLLGYDTVYFDSDDMKLIFVTAFNESRIVITKRVKLTNMKHLKVVHVRGDLLKKQISEIKKKIRLRLSDKTLLTRCSECNEPVFKINKVSIRTLVPEYVFKTQKNFFQCPSCAKIFWKATHWDNAKEFAHEICS